jgi:hypothetical protein
MRIVVGMAKHVRRRACGLGGAFGDDVRHLLKPPAMDGQEAETRTQRAVLDDGGINKQLRE